MVTLDYANPKVTAPRFNLSAVASLILALLGMFAASPPLLQPLLNMVGWPVMLVVIALPVTGFLLGARADESFRCNSPLTERGSRLAETAMLLNAIVLLAAVGMMALAGAVR